MPKRSPPTAGLPGRSPPHAEALALLELLRGRAAVAVVTNNLQAEQEEKLHTLGTAHLVDALVVFETVSVAKPASALLGLATIS